MYMKETEIWDGCDSVSFAVTIFENHTFNMMKLKQKHLKNTHTLKKLPAGIHTNGFQVLKTPWFVETHTHTPPHLDVAGN